MLNVQEKLAPGLYEVIQKTVAEHDTAGHFGAGVLENLLATPAYVDLMIKAASGVADKHLPEGFITIGKCMEFTHEAPTMIGMAVSVKATLAEIDGNRLIFDIIVYDEIGKIGHGRHERLIVNRNNTLKRAKERMGLLDKKFLK